MVSVVPRSPEPGWHPPASFSGQYRIERELGGGGMARVFLAEDSQLGRRVVVKFPSAELVAGMSADRFQREIRLAASLQHANIVPVLAAGEVDGLPFYTMPFMEGRSLRERLEQDGPPPLADAIGIPRPVPALLPGAGGPPPPVRRPKSTQISPHDRRSGPLGVPRGAAHRSPGRR